MLVTAVVTTQVYCHCVAAISASHTRPVCIMPNNLFAVRHFIVDSRMLLKSDVVYRSNNSVYSGFLLSRTQCIYNV